jgi:hypothetical protein
MQRTVALKRGVNAVALAATPAGDDIFDARERKQVHASNVRALHD